MTVPLWPVSRVAPALVSLLLVLAFHPAAPLGAEPSTTPEVQVSEVEAGSPNVDLFPADPLTNSPDGVPLVPPSGFIALPGAATTDWAQRIDQTWGASPLTIPQMLSLFDTFWTRIDQNFACFQGLAVGRQSAFRRLSNAPAGRQNWAALRLSAQAEIQAGVSRGRFAAIMNHLALALRESHTTIWDFGVNSTFPDRGVPLFVVGGWGDNRHFGACLTPLPDGSLVVYKATPSHPLGLVRGDIVLGYGGVPWKQLYPELLAAQLPLTGWWWGSSESSWTHSMLMSAGLNWHLFDTDTIDVVKHATGETVHLSLNQLGSTPQIDCTEQLPIRGVPMPDYLGSNDPVSWGVVQVQGNQVGYVYVRAWVGDTGNQFYDAVSSLLTQYNTSGLIFDFRTNYGGNMFLAYPALSLLFSGDTSTIAFARRCNGTDHFLMCPATGAPPSTYVIHGTAAADYDRPIAVLVGPGAVSSGDQVAHLLSFHPRARLFGKSTATAFNAPDTVPLPIAGWGSRYAAADAYRVTDPTNYLTHDELHVDAEVWLTPDDVAQGKDTVVEAALCWMLDLSSCP